MVFADLWPHPTNKQVLITRNSILLDYSSIVRNVGKVLLDLFLGFLKVGCFAFGGVGVGSSQPYFVGNNGPFFVGKLGANQ